MTTDSELRFSRVLIANRGEIAVRVIRAARDAGLVSIAVYADPDRDAVHVRLADEAYSLGGSTAQESYLDIDALLSAAQASGADAVHPGYGFLSESAEFAQRVIDAGLVWIGPSPDAIRALGDKVTARHIAESVGAPLAPGTVDPVHSADEIVAFGQRVGLPIAIKAAYGGGGRGLKIARTMEEIPAQFDSATREAVAAFGRGECFVEKYLEHPRHVETQCLADHTGNVVVVSTRDCSLQRRNQKLVEEAPAPFLTDEQHRDLVTASKAILRSAGYVGAGTCEFLIGADGTLSFLEVNTRLQVEHTVSEEVTGIDLVLEQFRIASGEILDYGDPASRGHAFEFRINAEDAGRGFLPQTGVITDYAEPAGPGVRVDSGVASGQEVSPAFDSLLAKLIVLGHDRRHALARARRALREFAIDGVPTVLPFHRLVVENPAFIGDADGFGVHTRWIESDFDNTIQPVVAAPRSPAGPTHRESAVLEVNGRRVEITYPAGQFGGGEAKPHSRMPRRRGGRRRVNTVAAAGAVLAPMDGAVVKTLVHNGDTVEKDAPLLVLEAMKMEQTITATESGVVTELLVAAQDTVSAGQTMLRIV